MPRIRESPSSVFFLSVSDIEPILSDSLLLSIERICSQRATEPPLRTTFKNSIAGADVESGTTIAIFRTLLSGLIERITTGRVF